MYSLINIYVKFYQHSADNNVKPYIFDLIMPAILEIDQFYKELGDRIKTERLKRKISQEDLGDRLGLTRASVVNLEKGRHRPSIYQLIQIASLFSLDYTRLIPFDMRNQDQPVSSDIDLENAVIDPELDGLTTEKLMHIVSQLDRDNK